MYEAFFGLKERPFELTPNPRFLVPTGSHGEALANLEYGIASRKGITLLVGEAGTGKTTLIRTAIERQSARVHCVYLHNPALTRDEFVETLAVRFGLSNEARTSKAVCLLELEDLLRQRRQMPEPETTVLVVDEAQSLPIELLEEIRLLANIETTEDKLMSVIVAGQPEIADRLNERALRQLKQRVALRCMLQPLKAEETGMYLAGRIQAAGGDAGQVLTRQAVAAIHQYSRGIPRTINVLAENALLTAFAVQERPVTRQVVMDVCRDFDLAAADPTAPPAVTPAPRAAAKPAPNAPSLSGRLLQLEANRPAAMAATVEAPPASVLAPAPAAAPTAADAPVTDEEAGPLFSAYEAKRRRFLFF
jgi:general secretion pathway protein A